MIRRFILAVGIFGVCATNASATGAPATSVRIEHRFVFTHAPFVACHASTVVALRDGSLLAAWFGGRAEGADNVAIWSSQRRGGQWSAPQVVAREPAVATWNPVLFHSRDGRLWLYYKFGPNVGTWTGARRWSRDEGRSWSVVEHLPAGLYGPTRTKPLVLRDGTVVSGTSVESYTSWAGWIERSTDDGRTFARIGPIEVSRRYDRPSPGESRFGIIQPAVVSLGSHHLRLYARPTSRIGRICISDSNDDGRSWSAAKPIDVPNPNSGLDAVAIGNGRIVLAYNDSPIARTPLVLAISHDGLHFHRFATLESGPGEYSYPAMIIAAGQLVITYTWRRSRIRSATLALADIR